MNHFDMDMVALFGLILLLGGVSVTFLKEMIIPMVGVMLLLLMVWGDDICSRHDRLNFYGNHVDRGGEIICKDDNAHPLLISTAKGWEHKGEYLFKGDVGVEILEDQCEILHQDEPHCINVSTQIIIGTSVLIGIFGWIAWMFRQLSEKLAKTKAREERKSAIEKASCEMAERYKNDPELKEWNEFVGDYYETSEEYMKESHHEHKND